MSKTLKQEIFHALIDQIPVFKYFEDTIWNSLFSNRNENIDLIQKEINEYCSLLYQSVDFDRSNPGAAKSAANDVIDIFKRVEISPELLLELKYSEAALETHFLDKGQDIMTTAGNVRQSLITEGIRRISRVVILAVVDMPEYRARLYNHLLVKLG
jgi:hypothetical protein